MHKTNKSHFLLDMSAKDIFIRTCEFPAERPSHQPTLPWSDQAWNTALRFGVLTSKKLNTKSRWSTGVTCNQSIKSHYAQQEHPGPCWHSSLQIPKKSLIEKSRECHNHKPQPTPNTKRKRKMTKTNTYKTNKCRRNTQTNTLFLKRGDHNAKRNDETWGQRAREDFKNVERPVV